MYSFVTLAGVGGKMSGSAGGVAVASTAFEVIEPAIVRWLYVRRLPSQSFAIDLSPKGVQRLYDEWDRLAADVHGADPDPADVAIYRESTESSAGPVQRTRRPVSFRLLASVADITQGDLTQMARIVSAHLGETLDDSDLAALLGGAAAAAGLRDPLRDRAGARGAAHARAHRVLGRDVRGAGRARAARA